MVMRPLAVFFVVSLWFTCVASAQNLGKISHVKGDAWVFRGGSKTTAKAGFVVKNGDTIKTGKEGKVEIRFQNGTVTRLGSYSTLKLNKGKQGLTVDTKKGHTWSKVKKGAKYSNKTPNAIAGVRSTVFRVAVDEKESTLVRVYEGQVEVKTWLDALDQLEEGGDTGWPPKEVEGPKEVSLKEWIKIVDRMMQVYIPATGVPEDPAPFDPEEDAKDPWVAWNLERDELVDQLDEYKLKPEEIEEEPDEAPEEE